MLLKIKKKINSFYRFPFKMKKDVEMERNYGNMENII